MRPPSVPQVIGGVSRRNVARARSLVDASNRRAVVLLAHDASAPKCERSERKIMSDPSEKVSCEQHGESHATFVCGHLARNAGLGFFTSDDSGDDPRPDAWCGSCDEVLAREGGWNERSEARAHITLLCAGCYDDARRRNRRRDPVLSPAGFTCADCGEQHHELPLDFGWDAPLAWLSIPEAERAQRTLLTPDLCVIDDRELFIRGCLEVPLVDAPSALVWGVWTSLSEKSFARVKALWDSDERIDEPPYFGWLCSRIPGYPDTVLLKTHVHTRMKDMRPYVELEPTDHPLAVEQREGITLERAREIAVAMLHRT
jgi:hypothetical protein